MSRRKPKGHVALVGAGPGDPGLLTVRGRDLLERADVVVLDRLASPELLRHCREDVEVVNAGKAPHGEGMTQQDINAVLVDRAKAGLRVVRLKGGDPFVFGRGGEEAEACAKARVPWEVVPGVTSAVAVPAYAGIPVTHRGVTQDLAVVSGHLDPAAPDSAIDWPALAAGPRTIVVLMGVEKVVQIAAALVAHGRAPDTPVAVIRAGTTSEQQTVVTTLADVERDAAGLKPPAVVVVGEVVRLRERLSWFEARPLFGMKVLVPRTRQQAGSLSAHLRDLGATPVEVPTIAVEPPRNPAPMDRAVTGLVTGRYAWVAFTSANAARAVCERLDALGLDARALAGVKVASVGDATTETLRAWGLRPDLVPSKAMTSEELAREWPPYDAQLDFLDRVLLPRADIATETLVAGVKKKGWAVDEVTAYRTVRAPAPEPELREAIRAGGLDAVVFTSSSTAKNLLALTGSLAPSTIVAAIGPQTAKTCRELGLRVDVESKVATVAAVAEALAEHVLACRAAAAAAPPRKPAARKPAAPARKPAAKKQPARAR